MYHALPMTASQNYLLIQQLQVKGFSPTSALGKHSDFRTRLALAAKSILHFPCGPLRRRASAVKKLLFSIVSGLNQNLPKTLAGC